MDSHASNRLTKSFRNKSALRKITLVFRRLYLELGKLIANLLLHFLLSLWEE